MEWLNGFFLQLKSFIWSSKKTKKIDTTSHSSSNKYHYRQSRYMENDENKETILPLVLILGWTAASDRNLMKYVEIYDSFGYHSIRFAPTTRLILFQTDQHRDYAQKLLDLIEHKKCLHKSPIIVHTFSNAGTFIYRHMSQLIHENDKYDFMRENLKAVIYDSGPGYPGKVIPLIGSIASLIQNTVKNKFIAYVLSITLLIAGFLKLIIFSKKPYYLDSHLDLWAKDPLHLPTLIFLSKNDHLVNYKSTLEHVDNRKKHATNVKFDVVLFEDTAHCGHYLKHKDLYTNKLKEHLKEARLPIYDMNNNF